MRGAVVRPSWLWLGLPGVMAIVAFVLLGQGNGLGLAAQMIAVTTLGIGIVRRPRHHVVAHIQVSDDGILVDSVVVARLADLVGMSVLSTTRGSENQAGSGRLVSLSIRGRAPLHIVVGSDIHVAELRAAIGLTLARSASRTFQAHAPLGCISALAAGATGLGAAILFTIKAGFSLLLFGMVTPALLIAAPLLFGRLKHVVLTCGEEGILVKRLYGSRLMKYGDIDSLARQFGSVVQLVVNKKVVAFELPSEEDANALVEDVRQRAAMPAPERDENIAAILARGERSTSEWLAAVRKQSSSSGEGYRNLHLAEDRLWAVLEDPSADPTARVAAAVALRAQASGQGHGGRGPQLEQRVRVAASTTAFPQIRIALEEVADAIDDDQVAARVMRVFS